MFIFHLIDFCLTKILVCDEETNYQSLRLSWASKSNCDQRKAFRSPLGRTILKVKLLDMGEPRALLATALSPPYIDDIERTILLLKEMGALAVCRHREDDNPYDGELTFLGKVLAQLPVDLHLGKLIVLGHVFGCLDECLIIASALSFNNFFAMPYKQHLDGYRLLRRTEESSVWGTFPAVSSTEEELNWGKSYYIQIKRIKEVAALYEELKIRISQFNMHITQRQAVDEDYKFKQNFILQVVMAGSFYPNYFTFGQSEEELAVRELGGRDPKTTVMLKNIPLYGFLYHKQIQSLFRQCGQVKSILFDGSKAYVEFSRNPTESFKILTAAYMALKMAQLKVPLILNIHSVEEIEERSEEAISSLKLSRVNVDFRKQTVDPVHLSQAILEQSETVKALILSINVTEVVEVGHFWGFRIDEQNIHILGDLTTEINNLQLMPLSGRPHPELVCLAPFTNLENQRYYRAQILYLRGDLAEVFFVDYGNRSKVKLNLLRDIPSYLLDLPFQALEFKICKMRPSAKSIIYGGHWSHAASERFASLVNGCALVVKVYSIVHSILHVDVYRHFENVEDLSIRDLLIADGFAEPAEESYESNQSNEVLKEVYSKRNKTKTAVSNFGEKEKVLINNLLENFSAKKFGAQSCKVLLHGPYNPYEVQFHSMMRVSKFRSVLIEKESINSIVINDTPEASHQRMFIAASLSVNASGSALMLRETSLLPSIPGLPAIISMLFAPVIELRVDQNIQNYTGVLCGLGWHKESGTAIWPERDMELAFDVQFNVDDIVQINLLRSAINHIVCHNPDGSLNLGHDRTAWLQEDVREKLINLIQNEKPREKIAPRWYPKLYHWNQV
ncbi:ATP-dependent RNA helicase TDRD9 [Bombina bombina]|uniref:ATP-dependent RNA helicase TDRD9 n=1 Tax=Bombina bombina TaxID=8345 RepID=UPI00235AD8CC|nr:ATP-dependent RNA helicase TDRD9 [Bombina bombina]